nr:UDP-N-acetylmuramoyl-L-alanyl-D-glutamate--2,6-diaminopimelate ligase [Acidisarcina polymorpha]
MKLSQLLAGVSFVRRKASDPEVGGVEYDSRRVLPGSLFVAMHGGSTDGNRYISLAAKQGAVAVVTDSTAAFDDAARNLPQLALIEVTHGRKALAGLASNFFAHPQDQLGLSGVTGTNGKTTTAFLLDAMLNHVARKTVLVGTIEYHVAGRIRPSPHTTPESRDLFELFREGVTKGATEAVMEVSSHALEQGRVWGLKYDVAIFTNLTRDHLDFHGTMEKYRAAKQSLFDGRNGTPPRVAVINLDDESGREIARAAAMAGVEIYGYGLNSGTFRAGNVQMTAQGMRFTLRTPLGEASISTRLTGKVNVYNLLAASAAAIARGLSLNEVVAGAAVLDHVPGRFQTVDAQQPFAVVVDYAHTDDALKNLIALARELVATHDGRVITLFGCGGDRDRTKRSEMGRVAGKGSDLVVLTSDNPRSEDPLAIISDVLEGLEPTCTGFQVEPDRGAAIAAAIQAARSGDIVLLAGKGHEKMQVLKDRTIPFDDVQVAQRALAALGFNLVSEATR